VGIARKKLLWAPALLVFVGAFAFLWAPERAGAPTATVFDNSSESTDDNDQPKILRSFSGPEFSELYNSISYPNTIEVSQPPHITGNSAADSRVQQLAEARGYRLKAVPKTNLVAYKSHFLQQKAYQPWLDLMAAAKQAGLLLDIVSAFRGVDDQRDIFIARLSATPESIAGGLSDKSLGVVLSQTAPPGYSRHHTGYTVDLSCNGSNTNFRASLCFTWLEENNYENSKLFGWIPSYPDGSGKQGPEPEAWEYVWVGVDALQKSD